MSTWNTKDRIRFRLASNFRLLYEVTLIRKVTRSYSVELVQIRQKFAGLLSNFGLHKPLRNEDCWIGYVLYTRLKP